MTALLARNETLVAAVIALFCIVAPVSAPNFLTVTTLGDLLRASIVLGILAIGAMLMPISGGIGVSFTAVAVSAMYIATKSALAFWRGRPWWRIFPAALLIGAALGAVNALFIAGFRLPTLIVALGTFSAFRGFLPTFVGSERISAPPPDMRAFSRMMIAFAPVRGARVGAACPAQPHRVRSAGDDVRGEPARRPVRGDRHRAAAAAGVAFRPRADLGRAAAVRGGDQRDRLGGPAPPLAGIDQRRA